MLRNTRARHAMIGTLAICAVTAVSAPAASAAPTLSEASVQTYPVPPTITGVQITTQIGELRATLGC